MNQEQIGQLNEAFVDADNALRILTAGLVALIATHKERDKMADAYRHWLPTIAADLPKIRGIRTSRALDAIDSALRGAYQPPRQR